MYPICILKHHYFINIYAHYIKSFDPNRKTAMIIKYMHVSMFPHTETILKPFYDTKYLKMTNAKKKISWYY